MKQQMDIKLQNNESLNNDSNEACISKYLNISLPQIRQRQVFIDAPRQIPKKSYSLAPDMVSGWKPKKVHRINYQNVFPLNFYTLVVDEIVKTLIKRASKQSKYEQLVYLGPRKCNSYLLHQNRLYENPYTADKKIQSLIAERPGVNKNIKLPCSTFIFDSDFQSGNLDAAIKITENQYDLFMRVDTNTRGHTNWYYFSIKNGPLVGAVKFNFCNFRRERSLYQRGMKPFVRSLKQGNQWVQKGYNIQYERKTLRYKFLYDQENEKMMQSQHMFQQRQG